MVYNIQEPIYICGDIHGQFDLIKPHIEKYDLSNCSIIFCGDIGLGFTSVKNWFKNITKLKLFKILEKRNVDLYFIRGNHDDPSWFDDKTILEPHVKAISDYSVLSSPNHNILCVGGGISIDRSDRILKMKFDILQYRKYNPHLTTKEIESKISKCYWETEAPEYSPTKINNITQSIDVVCTHVAPKEFSPLPLNRGYWFRVDPMLHIDCEKEREVLSQIKQHLIDKDHPIKYWFYGHYHLNENNIIDGIKTVLLDMARDKELSMIELRNE